MQRRRTFASGSFWGVTLAAILASNLESPAEVPAPGKTLSLEQVLDTYEKACDLPAKVVFTTTEEVHEAILKPAPAESSNQQSTPLANYIETTHFLRDGQRLDILQERKWDLSNNTTRYVPKDPISHTVIDMASIAGVQGTYSLVHNSLTLPQQDHRHVIEANNQQAVLDGTWFKLGAGRFLDGRPVTTGGKHIAQLIREGKDRTFACEKDSVSGHDLYVVGAHTPFGQCTIWIDAQVGFFPKKIEVRKTGSDIFAFGNTPLTSRKISELVQVVDEVEIQKIGQHFFPTACRILATVTHSSGKVSQTTSLVRRSGIDLTPQFGPDAFRITAPSGTPVIIDGNKSGIAYEWRDGKVAPAYDPKIVANINDAIKPVAPFAHRGPAVGTAWVILLLGILGATVAAAAWWYKQARRNAT